MKYSAANPYINQPQANSARFPRAIVTINRIQVKWIEIEITTNHFYVSDTFSIDLPLTGQPPEINLQYWALAGVLEVRIYIGFPVDPNAYSTQDLELFMTGNVTDFTIDPVSRHVRIHGRDLSARLIDRKLTEGFSGFTLTQLAERFALQNGLTPDVENTDEKIGVFYKNQQVILSNNSTQWDLLTAVAQLQNFVVYVNNETLVCIEREAVQNAKSPYLLQFQSAIDTAIAEQSTQLNDIETVVTTDSQSSYPTFNGMNLSLSRIPYSDVSVTIVVPYSFQSKKFISVTATSTNRHRQLNGLPPAQTRRFVHKYFGLTRQQAQLKAQQLLNSYLIHEFEINASLPGDNLLTKDRLVRLTGTGTEFDQNYYPDEIVRRISMDEGEEGGYWMHVNAKSQLAQTQVTVTA